MGCAVRHRRDWHSLLSRTARAHRAARRGGRAHRRVQPLGHLALPAPRDGSRRELRLQAVRPRGVGEAVRLDHAALSRGLSAAAVQPPVRAPLAGLVCTKASGRGLVGDVRRLDDAGPRLARRLRTAAYGAREARVLRAHGRRAWRSRAAGDRDRARRGRERHASVAAGVLQGLRGRDASPARPDSTATCARSSTTSPMRKCRARPTRRVAPGS